MRSDPPPGSLAEFSVRPLLQLVLPVADLDAARQFYQDLLGCRVVRAAARWIEFDFFANRVLVCLGPRPAPVTASAEVAGSELPLPHFALLLGWDDWHRAVDHLTYVGAPFAIAPGVRWPDTDQEQGLFALRDPDDHLVAFRAYRYPEAAYQTSS